MRMFAEMMGIHRVLRFKDAPEASLIESVGNWKFNELIEALWPPGLELADGEKVEIALRCAKVVKQKET